MQIPEDTVRDILRAYRAFAGDPAVRDPSAAAVLTLAAVVARLGAGREAPAAPAEPPYGADWLSAVEDVE